MRQTLEALAHDVGASVWLPPEPPRPPVVLLGHGGSGHRGAPRIVRLADRLQASGLAAIAIDGPFHGARAQPGRDYQDLIREAGAERILEQMVADWMTALDAVAGGGYVDPDRVAVFGLSMGARYGISVGAALGPGLRCAVVGKFGLQQAHLLDPGLDTTDRTREDARRITAPVLVHAQRDDQLFPFEGQVELFDEFGSADKRLVVRPGVHAGDVEAEEAGWCDLLARMTGMPDGVAVRASASEQPQDSGRGPGSAGSTATRSGTVQE